MIKKIIGFFFILFSAKTMFSQNLFEKGGHYVDINMSIGISKVNTQVLNFITKTNTINLNIPAVAYEYGLLNEIGVGLQFQKSYHFSKNTPSFLTSNTFLITNNLHYIRKENFDFIVGTAYGFGTYRASTLTSDYTSNGKGIALEIYLAWRYRLKEKITLYTKLAWNNENYNMARYHFNGIDYQSNRNSDFYTYLNGINVFFGISHKIKK